MHGLRQPSGLFVEPVVVDQTTEHRRDHGPRTRRKAVPVFLQRHRPTVGRAGDAGAEARVGTGVVGVAHPFPEDSQQVPRIKRNEPVEALSPAGGVGGEPEALVR